MPSAATCCGVPAATAERARRHIGASDGAEQGVERLRYPVEADRLGQQAGVAQLALRARAEEAAQLRRLVLSPPGRLPLKGAERVEVPVRGEHLRHPCGPGGADELVLQVLGTDEEARWIQASRGQAAPDDVRFARVAEPREPCAGPLGAEPPQVAGDAVGAADRQHHDALGRQVPAAPPGEGLDGDLVADPLDEHDGAGRVRPRQRHSGCLGGGRGPGHIAGEQTLAVVRPHRPHCYPWPPAGATRYFREIRGVSVAITTETPRIHNAMPERCEPGGEASSQERKPVSASSVRASSTLSESPVDSSTTTRPAPRTLASAASEGRRDCTVSDLRCSTCSGRNLTSSAPYQHSSSPWYEATPRRQAPRPAGLRRPHSTVAPPRSSR